MRAIGKDLEDDLLAVDDGETGEFLPIALLRGRKRLVEHDHVGAVGLGEVHDFLGLAAAEKIGGRGAAEIDEFGARDGDAQIFDQLLEFDEQFGGLTVF